MYLFGEDGINNTDHAIEIYVLPQSHRVFLILPKHCSDWSYLVFNATTKHVIERTIYWPGSASPVVSSKMWSKAPLRLMSFSMAATPVSLMLQQRQPFASSRNSSDAWSKLSGFSAEGIFIAFAVEQEIYISVTEKRKFLTFDILEKAACQAGKKWDCKLCTAVSPNSFMITAIR